MRLFEILDANALFANNLHLILFDDLLALLIKSFVIEEDWFNLFSVHFDKNVEVSVKKIEFLDWSI